MIQTPRSLVAVTMGDPAGIGPEICLSVLLQSARLSAVPVVFGELSVLQQVAQELDRPLLAGSCSLQEWRSGGFTPEGPWVVDLGTLAASEVRPGVVGPHTGRSAYACLVAAVEAAQKGRVAGLATGPIHKEALRAAGIPHPGHTEILAELTGTKRYCMMLTSEAVTCSFVTPHIGLADVPSTLSRERIEEVVSLTAHAMQRLRGRPPRLAVLALNPHAGEGGLFGRQEEERLIQPAIAWARSRGISVTDPLPPDTAFLKRRLSETDAYICMYHDQGHIPLKMLAFDSAINTTLGLPIIRTSVDHGTALDIAWRGEANPNSLFQAVEMVRRLRGSGP